MDHNPTNGWGGPHDKRCVYCHEPWPCPVAKTRRELAEHIRTQVRTQGYTGDPDYDHGRVTGAESAADTIDYEEN